MLTGSQPWQVAEHSDKRFELIINGKIRDVLRVWNSDHFVNNDAIGMYIYDIFMIYNNHLSVVLYILINNVHVYLYVIN